MAALILVHDLGTTNHKCVVYDEEGNVVTSAVKGCSTFYSSGGIAEQDPYEWWQNFRETTLQVLTKIEVNDIVCISFSGHMNGCLPVGWDGNPLMRSIIHADTRSNVYERTVFEKVDEDELYHITGNRISSRYTLLKMYWLKERMPSLYHKTAFFLQAKDYLAYKVTGNLGMTDYSDASLTGAFNISKRSWEEPIFSALKLNLSKMPQTVPSTEIIGHVQKSVAEEIGLIEGIPVVMGGGDGACATIGAGCTEINDTYISLGTTAWLSKVVEKPFIDSEKRVFTICDLNPDYFNVLGTVQSAGSAYEWAINNLSSIEWQHLTITPQYEKFEEQIKKVPAGSNGLIFHPYLLGERSPIWNDKARGGFFGLNINHNRFHMARSVLEGIAYTLESISEIINLPNDTSDIKMIGGLIKSENLNQIISDVLQRPLVITDNPFAATSLGAAVAGGVGIGMFPDFHKAAHIFKSGNRIVPNSEHSEIYRNQFKLFQQLYDCIKHMSFEE